ncbi:MAG: hypothetical protein VXZ53_10380, partial [Planctomycetota bacterium]|nr:hypothetical protein [Planctomycetota bacterium]
AAKLASPYGRWPTSLLLKTPYMTTGHRTTIRIIRTTPPQNTPPQKQPFWCVEFPTQVAWLRSHDERDIASRDSVKQM